MEQKREREKKWYFCRPAAKFTIAGEIWVSYIPLEQDVRDEWEANSENDRKNEDNQGDDKFLDQ